MTKINNRLQLLINLLPADIVIADIGTDHAYLPIESILQNKAKFAYAVDINDLPLEQAKQNINEANLNDFIKPVLSDGLEYFNENQIRLDYVVIAGLGASTIVKILEQDTRLVKNYLICSNTDPLAIRKLIKKRHWFIADEKFFVDKHHNYWIIKISKTDGTKIKTRQALYLMSSSQELMNTDYQIYLKKLYQQNEQILKVSHDYRKNKELKRYNRQILKVIK